MSSSENKPQKQTYWFYKWPLWLRIVLCIFLSPIFIPIVIWPIIKIPLWIKIILLTFYIVIVSFYLMFSSFSNLPKSNNKREEIPMEVSGIVENEIKKDDKVSLKIKTSPTLVDKITINDEEIKQGFFSNEYKFEKVFPEGDNKIRIFAKKDSKVTEKEINFKVDLSERKATEEAKRLEQVKKDEEKRLAEEAKKQLTNKEYVFNFFKEYEKDFEVNIWNDINTDKVDDVGPYEVILNKKELDKSLECTWAKRTTYSTLEKIFKNIDSAKIKSVKITIPYNLRIEMGANVGKKTTDNNLWRGQTNFWSVMDSLGNSEDTTTPIADRIWSIQFGNCQ
jgi:hypothetical protein